MKKRYNSEGQAEERTTTEGRVKKRRAQGGRKKSRKTGHPNALVIQPCPDEVDNTEGHTGGTSSAQRHGRDHKSKVSRRSQSSAQKDGSPALRSPTPDKLKTEGQGNSQGLVAQHLKESSTSEIKTLDGLVTIEIGDTPEDARKVDTAQAQTGEAHEEQHQGVDRNKPGISPQPDTRDTGSIGTDKCRMTRVERLNAMRPKRSRAKHKKDRLKVEKVKRSVRNREKSTSRIHDTKRIEGERTENKNTKGTKKRERENYVNT
ncbi:hypothetical protein Tco_0594765 [Tanacetum coccineum]